MFLSSFLVAGGGGWFFSCFAHFYFMSIQFKITLLSHQRNYTQGISNLNHSNISKHHKLNCETIEIQNTTYEREHIRAPKDAQFAHLTWSLTKWVICAVIVIYYTQVDCIWTWWSQLCYRPYLFRHCDLLHTVKVKVASWKLITCDYFSSIKKVYKKFCYWSNLSCWFDNIFN